MRALSLHQPWASAIAAGLKVFETRHWRLAYRGPLAIHATRERRLEKLEIDIAYRDEALRRLKGAKMLTNPLPSGIVALAELVSCIPTEEMRVSQDEAFWGNFGRGRFAFGLVRIRPLRRPFPIAGKQGLWTIDPPTWTLLEAAAAPPPPAQTTLL